MIDRVILMVLFGLIVVFAAAMGWANTRNPPD
jgi:hypothetical protein